MTAKAQPRKRKPGALTDPNARRTTKYGGPNRLCDFEYLPANLKLEAERMLENGATFEDTTEWINQRHAPQKEGDHQGVTLGAVSHYYRCNLGLQARRIRRQQQTAQNLKQALIGDPDSAQAELADAVFLAGVMGLEREGARSGTKDAAKLYLSRLAAEERARTGEVKRRQIEVALKAAEERIQTETVKRENLQEKMRQVARTLEREGRAHQLGPEALRQIQEIYGLVGQEGSGSHG
jgi:hypothetical protein